MVKFLHISDIHLGTNQYNSPGNARKKDFYLTFKDVIDKYAITESVDFVIIAGDLFDKNRIDPNTLSFTIAVFKDLKNNNIPAFVVEGNHDTKWDDDSVSWLEFLAEHEYIYFLKTDIADGYASFKEIKPGCNIGGYYNFNDQIRIIGIQWLGSSLPKLIPNIAESINALGSYPYTIFIMHAGLEGFLSGYGYISKSNLEPLKHCVNYLALGHIHKYYTCDGWIYNPGSLEACCFPEYFDEHGAILVEIDQNNVTKTTLINDYKKREFIKIHIDISKFSTANDTFENIKQIISRYNKISTDQPLIELVIDGTLNFRRTELDLNSLKEFTKVHFDALLVLLKYFARPRTYNIEDNLSIKNSRNQLEKTVIKDMLSQYNAYNNDGSVLSDVIIQLKDMVLESESNENMLNYLKDVLTKQ